VVPWRYYAWDAAVMMPRGSADVRGEQLAALETEYHALVTAPKITRLLDRAQASLAGLEDWQIANLREMRRQRDFAIATPVALVSRLAKAASKAESENGLQAPRIRQVRGFPLRAPRRSSAPGARQGAVARPISQSFTIRCAGR